MADEDYGDDDAFYFDDDDYLYVEDDYAIAVSSMSLLQPIRLPFSPTQSGSQVPGACMSHASRSRMSRSHEPRALNCLGKGNRKSTMAKNALLTFLFLFFTGRIGRDPVSFSRLHGRQRRDCHGRLRIRCLRLFRRAGVRKR